MIRLKSEKEIDLLRNSGKLAAEILKAAAAFVKPGVTTDEINQLVHDKTVNNGAYPSPLHYKGFPKSVCTSVNEVVTHGIPSGYVLKEGDIVNIDVTCNLEGYHGDCSQMVLVGDVSEDAKKLVEVTERCLRSAIDSIKRGSYLNDIGDAIQEIADQNGYGVVRDYCGHGIGRGFHEDPMVLHYQTSKKLARLVEGMVFTIEPMINQGGADVKLLNDGWTVVTQDGSLSAQFEHTIAVTRQGIEVLTLQH